MQNTVLYAKYCFVCKILFCMQNTVSYKTMYHLKYFIIAHQWRTIWNDCELLVND
ncbi:unnamed protein product, partial [Candidula unifasciata]